MVKALPALHVNISSLPTQPWRFPNEYSLGCTPDPIDARCLRRNGRGQRGNRKAFPLSLCLVMVYTHGRLCSMAACLQRQARALSTRVGCFPPRYQALRCSTCVTCCLAERTPLHHCGAQSCRRWMTVPQ